MGQLESRTGAIQPAGEELRFLFPPMMKKAWVSIPALIHTGCETKGKFLNSSQPQFVHL